MAVLFVIVDQTPSVESKVGAAEPFANPMQHIEAYQAVYACVPGHLMWPQFH